MSLAASGPRRERLVLVALASGLLGSLPFYVATRFDGTDVDASMYIVMARSLARGEGYRYLGAPFILHPPGLSALLAPIVGTLGTSFTAMNLLGCLFGASAVLLLFVFQRERAGGWFALLTAIVLWLDPGFRAQCNRVLSDVPGLALLLAALVLERRAARSPLLRREIALGALIGLSAYVRWANILVVPCILAARVLRRMSAEHGNGAVGAEPRGAPAEPWRRWVPRRLLLFASVAVACVAPWIVRTAAVAPPPPSDQTMLYTISTAMWHVDPGDPRSPRFTLGEVLSRPRALARPLRDALGSGLQSPSMDDPPSPAANRSWQLVAALIALSLLVTLVRRREPAEMYAAGMTLFFLLYFTFVPRLALPIYALGLASVFDAAGFVLRRVLPPRPALAAGAALAAFFLVANFEPFGPRRDVEAKHREGLEVAAAAAPQLRAEDRVASSRGPRWSVYLDRPVYNLRHAIRRTGQVEAAETVIDKYGIDAVLLAPSDPDDAALVPYFRRLYGEGEPVGPARLWRVRPR